MNWQNYCFDNPRSPVCPNREFAGKRQPAARNGGTSGTGSPTGTAEESAATVDAGGIDWRFADPSADALAVLTCSKLSASPLAHNLIDQLGASQGLSQQELQRVFRALSGVKQVALSIRQDRIVLLVTGRAADSVLPAPAPDWKATTLADNSLLIGHADAVDQAVQRLSMEVPLSELSQSALDRQADNQFWAVGPATLAGPEAAAAGVKQFSLSASLQDRFISDTIFAFNEAPDPSAIQSWTSTLQSAKVNGPIVHSTISMDTDETRQNFGRIAASPAGQPLGVLVKSGRYLPVRDTAATVHIKPVIFGLDDGPREVKQ